jgi:hypothetical protein
LECKTTENKREKEKLQAKLDKENNNIRKMRERFESILEKTKEKTLHSKNKMRLAFEQQKVELAKGDKSADRVNKQKEAQENKAKIKEDDK